MAYEDLVDLIDQVHVTENEVSVERGTVLRLVYHQDSPEGLNDNYVALVLGFLRARAGAPKTFLIGARTRSNRNRRRKNAFYLPRVD